MQRVDLTALISSMTDARSETTAYGPKKIVDVTIVDGDDVSATFTVFFDDTSAGTVSLKSMQEAAAAKAPLALFGLTCSPHGSKCEFKTSQSFFWEKADGAYAKLQRLQNEAPDVLQATCTSITAEWTPSSYRERLYN